MSLTTEQVLHIARLARIRVSENEVESLKLELNDILAYVEHLSEVDVRGVPPTSHVHGIVNVFREDVVEKSLPIEALERIAPDFDEEGFCVPKII